MSQPLLSIIIPVYNVENYIEECLNSILKQDFHDMEIICINDGSTDNSLSILHKLQLKDSRIKIITQENRGLARVRNRGMEASQGRYLWFIDGDDFIAEDCLTLLTEKITTDQNQFDMVQMNVKNYYEDTHKIEPLHSFDQTYVNRCISGTELLQNSSEMHMGMCFRLIKRDFCLRYGKNPEEIYYEDVIPTLTLLENAQNILCLPLYGYYYRQRPGSITHSNYSLLHVNGALFNAEKLILAYHDNTRVQSIALENTLLHMCYIAFAFGYPYRSLTNRRRQLQKQLQTIFKKLSLEARTEHNRIDKFFYCYYPVFLVNNHTEKLVQFLKKFEYFLKKFQK